MPSSDETIRRVTNPLPQLTPPRIQGVKWRVDGMVWKRTGQLKVAGSRVLDKPVPFAAARRLKVSPVRVGEAFGPKWGGWAWRWFRVEVPAPKAGERGRRHLMWDCPGEDIAYIDGEPWAGLDRPHKNCPLPDRAVTVWVNAGLWQGADRYGTRFNGAEVGVRNDEAWDASMDLEILLEYMRFFLKEAGFGGNGDWGYLKPMESLDPRLRRLLFLLEEACDAFDHGGLSALRPALKRVWRELPAEKFQPEAAVMGYAHLDQVWLWPERVTEHKGIHTSATQLMLMTRYPEYRYTQSQPSQYRAMERLEPGMSARIRRRIREGRWEATGALEVEQDTNLPSGESLARSLVYGQRKFEALRGSRSAVCWLPDVFGYSSCLPQVLSLGGAKYFYTTKMGWSQINKFPYSSFVWRASDGTGVLTQLCKANYNGMGDIPTIVDGLREHRQSDVHPGMIMPTGYGDGGGGPTPQILERLRRLKSLSGVPRARWTSAERFFAEMERVRDKLPVYQGELYLEFHRGTYTTQSEFKRLHRGAERALQAHEAVRVATGGRPLGEKAWLRVLFSEFHDAIPGSSINIVYKELNPELASIAARELEGAVTDLGGKGPGWSVFNPSPLARRAVIGVGEKSAPVLVSLAGLEGKPLEEAMMGPENPVKPASPRVLDNGLIRAEFGADGSVTGLSVDGVPLELGRGVFGLYTDEPANFDAWDIDHHVMKKGSVVGPLKLKVAESGPLRAVLEGTAKVGEKSRLTVRYVLEAESRWLRVEAEVEWQETHKLLKYHAQTGYRGRFARYGCPFGSIVRPQQPGDTADEAMWEVPGSRWAAVTREDGAGLAVLTEAKYGFSCRDGDLGLSLLRATKSPDHAADMGRHLIRFALGKHEPAERGGIPATAGAADALFAPVLRARGSREVVPPFTLENPGSLVPSWVLPCEESRGFIVRLHETNGSSGTAVLRLAQPRAEVDFVDFLERSVGKARKSPDGGWLIPYSPYRIVSVRVRRG